MNPWRPFVRFNAVGLAGAGVQLAAMTTLVHALRLDYRPATAAALGITLLHNFLWHLRWTWRDRELSGAAALRGFVMFVWSNGMVSIVGASLLMPLLVDRIGLPAVIATVVSICVCGPVNFWLASRAFTGNSRTEAPRRSRPLAALVWRPAGRPSTPMTPAPDRPGSSPAPSSVSCP